jgi:lysophospholipase L1-like esterase
MNTDPECRPFQFRIADLLVVMAMVALLRYLKSLADIFSRLGDEHFADELHPNAKGAKIIAEEVFKVLAHLYHSLQELS